MGPGVPVVLWLGAAAFFCGVGKKVLGILWSVDCQELNWRGRHERFMCSSKRGGRRDG